MLQCLRGGDCDLVVGSRYAVGGGLGDLSAGRAQISGMATRLSRLVYRSELADPMSGFFMLRRALLEDTVRRLSGQGFKILLDILASSPRPVRIKELPYTFRQRRHGESKLDTLVAWEFMMLIADKSIGHLVPVRFALFALIGGLGLVVHLAVLWTSFEVVAAPFASAQTAAAVVAMTSNFFLNNLFTYRDKRLQGWRLLRGLVSFYLICAVGAVANVGIATYAFAEHQTWWVAGIAGVIEITARDLPVTSPARAVVKDVRQEIARINHIVTDLLQTARPHPPRVRKSDLNTTVEHAVMLGRQQVLAKSVEITLQKDPSQPQVEHDSDQIHQVLLNLLLNSLQAIDQDGSIRVAVKQKGGMAVIELTDNGRGIAPEHLPNIFRPFYTTKGEGTGLGLSLVRRIVEDHQGRIEVTSAVGKGSTFVVFLPLQRTHRQEPAGPLRDVGT